MTDYYTKRKRELYIFFTGVLLWNALLYILDNKTAAIFLLFNVAIAVLFLIGGLIGIQGGKNLSLNTYIGRGVIFCSIALLANAVSSFMWTYYSFIGNPIIPYPSPADLFRIFFILLLFFGLLTIIKIYQFEVKIQTIIESFILLALVMIGLFYILNQPNITLSINNMAGIFDAIYIISDVVLIMVAIIISRTVHSRVFKGIHFLTLGTIFTTIGDLLFTITYKQGAFWNGNLSTTAFAISGLLFSYGIIKIVQTFQDPHQKTI